MSEEEESKLRILIESGQRIEELMKHPGWKDLMNEKDFWQMQSTQTCRVVKMEDPLDGKRREHSAIQWSTIEGFFNALKLRVKHGKAAEKELARRKS